MANVVPHVAVEKRPWWSTAELAAILAISPSTIRDWLVDDDGNHIAVADAVDGHCWVLLDGIIRIPARINHNHDLRFVAAHFHAALEARGLALADPT